jgi:hypothetical protein
VAQGRGLARLLQEGDLAGGDELLEEFRNEFDLTLFDSPPLLPYAEALVLASKVDRVLLERRRRVALDLLQAAPAHPVGRHAR